MVGPDQSKFHRIEQEPSAEMVAHRGWTRFDEGEVITIKGVPFRVHEIGETRMVLKLINAT